jgi:acyl CoA:acetate/3-ketoacid CoA transferase alpha subunit
LEPKKSKVWNSVDEAVKDVKSGDTLLVGGFGLAGVPGMSTFLVVYLGVHERLMIICLWDRYTLGGASETQ